jgi:AraC-like DNA-binding protein
VATIRDVATHAGVSPATVSRVVNGLVGYSEETRERVEEAVRKLSSGRGPGGSHVGPRPAAEDPDYMLRLATQAIALRRRLWDNGVFTADDGGTWHVKEGNMLLCERNRGFLVAVAMGTKPGKLPAGVVLFSAFPLEEDGWLQPDNAVWLRRDVLDGNQQ